MKTLRRIAAGFLVSVVLATLLAAFLAPAHYATQFREAPNSAPSGRHPLGTDELGRDAMSRLLYGTRVSLLLAPAAALVATLIAALVGGTAGFFGGWWEGAAMRATDLFLSLPWLFLLLTVRALLPLNIDPVASVAVTFGLLGCLGWAASARVVCAGMKSLRNSDFILQARACGCNNSRILFQAIPNLKPVLTAQFWISIPVFILAEANLGLLGLGVAEPLPSWGNLLRGLENTYALSANPWRLMPLILLIAVVSCFQLLLSKQEVPA